MLTILPLQSLPIDFAELEADSVAAGFSMLTRLREEWHSGANRFVGPGEILLGAHIDGRLIGTGGLHRDPYLDDPQVGRLRHVYVLQAQRGRGVGREIVARLLTGAETSPFRRLRLRTKYAAGFYVRLGWTPVDEPNATHSLTV